MLKKIPIICLFLLMLVNALGSRIDDTLKLVLSLMLVAISIGSVLWDMKNIQDPKAKRRKYIYLGLCILIPTLMTVYFFLYRQ